MSYDCPICGAHKAANCDCAPAAIAAIERVSELEAQIRTIEDNALIACQAAYSTELKVTSLKADAMKKVVLAAQDWRRTQAGLPMVHIRDRVRIMDEKSDALCEAIAEYEGGTQEKRCECLKDSPSVAAISGVCLRCGGVTRPTIPPKE